MLKKLLPDVYIETKHTCSFNRVIIKSKFNIKIIYNKFY